MLETPQVKNRTLLGQFTSYPDSKRGEIKEILKENEYYILDACQKVGISTVTFYSWIKKYPDWADELKEIKYNIPTPYYKKKASEKIIKYNLGLTGSKNHNWTGGRKDYPEGWTDALKESIRQRDNYICQECGTHQDELNGYFKQLDVHHIDYNTYNLNPNNLIALCRSCHIKTNHNREYWIEYFNN